MMYSAKQYAQALLDSLTDTDPKDTDKILDNFAKLLAENNDLRMFDQIGEEFTKLELQRKGIKQVEVTSAHPLNKESEKKVIEELNHLIKGKFEIKKKLDENLIGGVVIKVEDQVLDASVKNELEQLKKNLTN